MAYIVGMFHPEKSLRAWEAKTLIHGAINVQWVDGCVRCDTHIQQTRASEVSRLRNYRSQRTNKQRRGRGNTGWMQVVHGRWCCVWLQPRDLGSCTRSRATLNEAKTSRDMRSPRDTTGRRSAALCCEIPVRRLASMMNEGKCSGVTSSAYSSIIELWPVCSWKTLISYSLCTTRSPMSTHWGTWLFNDNSNFQISTIMFLSPTIKHPRVGRFHYTDVSYFRNNIIHLTFSSAVSHSEADNLLQFRKAIRPYCLQTERFLLLVGVRASNKRKIKVITSEPITWANWMQFLFERNFGNCTQQGEFITSCTNLIWWLFQVNIWAVEYNV